MGRGYKRGTSHNTSMILKRFNMGLVLNIESNIGPISSLAHVYLILSFTNMSQYKL